MIRLERGISLAGPLAMKQVGGALTYLRIKKRLYFAIDEINHKLVYFRDEADFIKKKDPIDEIPLHNAVFTIAENNEKTFIIHYDDKRLELEADNVKSCECWMEALARRRGFTELQTPRSTSRNLQRKVVKRRDRSHSLPSESELVNKRNGGLSLLTHEAARKYSYNQKIAEPSTFNLAVLEEKLRALRAFGVANQWSEESDGADSDCTTVDEPLNDGVPVWLDEWVNNWMLQQPFTSNSNGMPCTASLATSTETSPYDSQKCSTASSDIIELDELHRLRAIDNRQKERIQLLNAEKRALSEQIEELKKKTEEATPAGREVLANQNRFLNGEVLRLNKKCGELEIKLKDSAGELNDLHEEVERYKREYVFVLQSCIRIPLHDNHSLDIVQVKLYGGDVHKKRVCEMLDAARIEDPSLPTMQSLLTGTYVDTFGFRQYYVEPALAIHYISTQLHTHFSERLESTLSHRQKWRTYLENNNSIPLTKETKSLCRIGVPNSLRSTVWKLLIHQQVVEMKINYGKYYFRNLCSLQGGDAEKTFCSQHQKQINLDLLRTMPNNVHFMSANCKGVSQLQQVLRAFCLHNGTLGYCQGMNFLAATALLFVGPEDAFWFLIALTEKFFDRSYFDESLAGAQADQEVLKELLELKFPRLYAHLDECDIELATVTLNWFIALFFDAVPFQTLLRIWDCFLLEGPKVLFRFAVALLGLHEDEILQKNDTIGIMKVVKAAVKLSYDIDGLFTLAFADMNPFPSRVQLRSKQAAYLAILQERLSKRQHRRDALTSSCDSAYSSGSLDANDVPISDLAMSPCNDGTGFVVAGNQHIGYIGKIALDGVVGRMNRIDTEFDCRIVSLVIVGEDMAFASLISGYIVALQCEGEQCSILWELKLNDVALKLLHCDNRIYAALANGTLTILENVIEKAPTSLELLHVPVGSAPITDAVIVDDCLWLAVACKIVLLQKESLSPVSSIYVACSANGSGTPFFEKVHSLAPSPFGVFLVTAHSTLIQLWTEQNCSLLFDISFDHSHRKPSLDESNDDFRIVHIAALCFLDGVLWVGTSDGYVIMYAAEHTHSESRYRMQRYPAGRRLSPKASPGSVEGKTPLCYIPTREETQNDEDAEGAEFPLRAARRVSVVIDQDTNQYKVSVGRMKSKSFNHKQNGPALRIPRSSSFKRRPLTKGYSADSAVSVFSSEFGGADATFAERYNRARNSAVEDRRRMLERLHSSTGSSNMSMDYDDLFELYSEDDRRSRRISVPQFRGPVNKTMTGSCDLSCPKSECTPCAPPTCRKPRLRRKDLVFDDPLVVAVQEEDESELTEASTSSKSDNEPCDHIISTVGLTLLMKLKISDRAVRNIVPSVVNGDDVMITSAGNYGDEEALLKWYKDKESGLWINDPIVDALAHRRYSVISSTPSSPRTVL